MVTQKAISLKIDYQLLQELDKEVSTGWMKRNTHINQAIAFYLELKDVRRRIKCFGNEDDKKREANKWLRHWFPEIAEWYPGQSIYFSGSATAVASGTQEDHHLNIINYGQHQSRNETARPLDGDRPK